MAAARKIGTYLGRDIYEVTLDHFDALPKSINLPTPFFHAAILADMNEISSLETLKQCAKDLLDRGARYFVCAGSAADVVHDVVDELRATYPYERSEEDCIPTTSHKDEPLSEVVWFTLNAAFASDQFEIQDPSKIFIILRTSRYLTELRRILGSLDKEKVPK